MGNYSSQRTEHQRGRAVLTGVFLGFIGGILIAIGLDSIGVVNRDEEIAVLFLGTPVGGFLAYWIRRFRERRYGIK